MNLELTSIEEYVNEMRRLNSLSSSLGGVGLANELAGTVEDLAHAYNIERSGTLHILNGMAETFRKVNDDDIQQVSQIFIAVLDEALCTMRNI